MASPYKQHLPYLVLYDAAFEKTSLTVSEWHHLQDCDECMLMLATILLVRNDFYDLRNKYTA